MEYLLACQGPPQAWQGSWPSWLWQTWKLAGKPEKNRNLTMKNLQWGSPVSGTGFVFSEDESESHKQHRYLKTTLSSPSDRRVQTWREKDLGKWSWQGIYLDKMLQTPLSLLVVDEERLTSNCLICVIIWEIIKLLMWKREWRQGLLISTLLLKPTITNIFLYQLTAANLKLTSMFIQRIVVKIHLREMFI